MKKLVFVAILMMGSFAVSAQQTTLDKDIRELLEVSGAAKVGVQVMEAMTVQFKQMLPNVPTEFWDEAMKEFKSDALIDLVIPIYKKYYTHDEVKQLIAFYKTPLGQKVTNTLPAITQESMEAGQQWGQEIGMKIAQKLQEKGYIKN